MSSFFNAKCHPLPRIRGRAGLGMMLCLLLFVWSMNCAALPVARQYQVKAVFLLNFANFVTWPQAVFASAGTPFHLCVLGQNPFGKALELTVEDEDVGGHAITVEYLSSLEKIAYCHLLFINRSEEKRLPEILERVREHPVLTVSDMNDFVVRGGMVQFFKYGKKKKIRFYIDPETVKEAGLRISGNILRIAKIVRRPYKTKKVREND
ncbi:MAG: YfiR family protein [Gammaproteobacteria bacterium]|nr:YfiR family protein [Gammaproteobacteria bacterium]